MSEQISKLQQQLPAFGNEDLQAKCQELTTQYKNASIKIGAVKNNLESFNEKELPNQRQIKFICETILDECNLRAGYAFYVKLNAEKEKLMQEIGKLKPELGK